MRFDHRFRPEPPVVVTICQDYWDGGDKIRETRQRIAALLFAFAALADRAGARPRLIRVTVLWLLRTVESIAWEFVIAVARESGAGPDVAVPAYAHDVADDAGRLARSFTALAELLTDLASRDPSPPLPCRISSPVDRLMRTLWHPAPRPEALARPLPDTS
jgi:hypothetical protein